MFSVFHEQYTMTIHLIIQKGHFSSCELSKN